jgi:hypothetical protein
MKFLADRLEVEVGIISTGPQRRETVVVPASRLSQQLAT